ncbi:hypothetical protein G7Z17_g495 [Cylindrodendrum hubeiense]|uniref:Transcription factor domain-containing protein n=1 Tax=Cylindrodendrum hubeiense TaxID=595255 RepID=A0A9P5HKC1_9HYPO|nr:hypothetical protein G7Z17_g495 [Cylindrodendrum hubeiense]
MPASRRNGVRNSRKPPRDFATRPTPEHARDYRSSSVQKANDQCVLSPAQSSDAAADAIGSPSNRHIDGFISPVSVLSYDAASVQTPRVAICQPSLNIQDEILRITQASTLPRPSLLQALKESFSEHMSPLYPIIDPSDIAKPDSSVLLQQAVCLAGSLLRHDQTSMGFASSQYEKVKTLIYLNHEPENIVVLKTLCIMICWSPSSTDLNTDKIMTACWGRPPALRVDDYDIDSPSICDFPAHNMSATIFLECRKVIDIIGTIGELNLQKRVILPDEVSTIITTLCNWQRDLPDEVRLFDANGLRQPFYRPLSELHIYYFVAIILLQTLGQNPKAPWPFATPALIASSCIASLYEEINSREQTAYLLHYHGFLCMAAAVPLIYSIQPLENETQRYDMMDSITSILHSLKFKYGGAEFVLRKIHRLRSDIERFEGPMSNDVPSFFTLAQGLGTNANQLFPFPSSFSMGMDLLEFVDSGNIYCSEALVMEPNVTLFDMLGMDLGAFDIFEPHPTLESLDCEQGMDRT